MSRKEWIGVLVVVGLGIVWQIPGHDDAMTDDHEAHGYVGSEVPVAHGASPSSTDMEIGGPYRTVALEVTGMT